MRYESSIHTFALQKLVVDPQLGDGRGREREQHHSELTTVTMCVGPAVPDTCEQGGMQIRKIDICGGRLPERGEICKKRREET